MIDKAIEATTKPANAKTLNTVKWGLIILIVVANFLVGLNIGLSIFELVAKVAIVGFAWIHGMERYGIKNMLTWFGITWLVSNFFEGLR